MLMNLTSRNLLYVDVLGVAFSKDQSKEICVCMPFPLRGQDHL